MGRFVIGEEDFQLDGEKIRLISGAVHYFRIHPDLWVDRLNKLKYLGLNCLELYVPWNLHEPREGEYDFGGRADVERFIRLAQARDFLILVRPGPYICAEWEFGGFPPWLLKYGDMRLRTADPAYLEKVDRWFDILVPRLASLQIDTGGPVIACQVENEYGSYSNDKNYLSHLARGLKERGMTVPLFTSDGELDDMLTCGTLADVFKTVNFGSHPDRAFEQLRKYQKTGPLMCMELWNGWFDHWFEEHHGGDHKECARVLEEVLKEGRSVNLYMAHGGTNFGFMNGANHNTDSYQPTVTSYDYDAALSECGDITPKFRAFRDILGEVVSLPDYPEPSSSRKISLPSLKLTDKASLLASLDSLSTRMESPAPLSMEQVGQNYGFILYRTIIPDPRTADLFLPGVRDRAQIFLNGRYSGVIYRNDSNKSLSLTVPPEGGVLEILVENMGRINYGPDLFDRKGIVGDVLFGRQILSSWDIYPLPMKDLDNLHFTSVSAYEDWEEPVFYQGHFTVEEKGDTFLALPGWEKGVVWLNRFNLGRYWKAGPQKTLYAPAPLLKEGENELIVLELHNPGGPVEFRDTPDLG